MRISLVLSTYNGAKYIEPQLDSLRNQTRKIDEVIIRDDKSSDNICDIIESYISFYSLDWQFIRGAQNLGWRDAFYEITKLATGDVIFFCDQDDIWCESKIEVMSDCFKNKDVHLLVADFIRFNYNDVPNAWHNKNYHLDKFDSNYKWPYIQRPGCTMAFNRLIRDLYLQIFKSGDAHDLLVWQIAGVIDSIWYIDYNAIFFRRHDTNSTPKGIRTLDGRLKDVEALLKMSDRLSIGLKSNATAIKRITELKEYLLLRKAFLKDKSIFNFARILLYYKYYTSYKSILADIFSK